MGRTDRDLPSFGLGLNLLEPRLSQPHAAVVIPLDHRITFVRLFDCAQFASRLSEVAQTLDSISGLSS
jgi:hypothetical protein